MTLYAIDNLDDAISATRAMLWPVSLGTWAKLALVILFVGSVGGSNPFQFTGGGGDVTNGAELPEAVNGLPAIGGVELLIIAAIIAFIVLIGIIFVLIGSIMEFVFVEALRQEVVSIRAYWREHWRRGIRLFGFRVILWALTAGIVGLLLLAALMPLVTGAGDISVGLLIIAAVVGFSLAVISGIVNSFTTMFVVPIMMLESRGVLSGWRRFWPTMTGQWKQYLAYLIAAFILGVGLSVAAGILILLGALVLAIPFGILVGIGILLLSVSAIGWAIIVPVGILYVLSVIVLALFVAVPVQTYLRYYALLVLGDSNDGFDIMPDRREAIRGAGETA